MAAELIIAPEVEQDLAEAMHGHQEKPYAHPATPLFR
jgi:hypothetical protein